MDPEQYEKPLGDLKPSNERIIIDFVTALFWIFVFVIVHITMSTDKVPFVSNLCYMILGINVGAFLMRAIDKLLLKKRINTIINKNT